MSVHRMLMREAITVAKQNPQAPFGSILYDRSSSEIVARGVNAADVNPTHHGEIAAINDYVRSGWDKWSELVIYTTAEPCCMCQGAILWSGIRRVVFGASIADLRRLGWRQIDISASEVVARSWTHSCQVIPGIEEEPCRQLFAAALGPAGPGAADDVR